MSSDAMGTDIANAVLALTPAEKADTELAWQTISTQIFKYLSAIPIGVIKPWDKSMPNTPALDANWAECNGQLISDADSPYNGYRIRNLNGANVVFSVSWVAGVATISSNNLPALAIGDYVSGSGISSNTYITDITGNTVTISDTGFTGTISTTFTNNGRFIRGGANSGIGQDHAMQRIQGEVYPETGGGSPIGLFSINKSGVFNASGTPTSNVIPSTTNTGETIAFDSAQSVSPNPAKTDDVENRPINITEVFIMKIKNG